MSSQRHTRDLLWLLDSPLCRKCGVGEETSAHILCECEALASLRRAYLGSFFLELEDIRRLDLVAIWNYSKVMGAPLDTIWGTKGPFNSRRRCIGAERPRTQMQTIINQSINQHNVIFSGEGEREWINREIPLT